jgi:hypothetical protein
LYSAHVAIIELRKLPYLATRFRQLSFRFFLVQTWLVVAYFVLVIISAFAVVNVDATGGRTGLLSTTFLVSIYCYLLAFCYLPADETFVSSVCLDLFSQPPSFSYIIPSSFALFFVADLLM